MYINWTHYYLPKVFGILSYIFNIIFITLILSERKNVMGKYKYLLVFFAIFDMVYSTVELVVPISIHGTGAAFTVYLTDGPFFESEKWGQLSISVRCGFISLSYGILIVHFLYRYFAIFNPHVIRSLAKPSGIIGLLIFFIAHGVVWSTICEVFLYADDEIHRYIYDAFNETYHVDSSKIPMLIALYMDGSDSIIFRSWAGILILTGISIYAITLYIYLGTKITRKFSTNAFSAVTKRYHKQLFKSLVIQTVIPLCISFAPCMVAWYGPVLKMDLGKWNNYLGVIALSAFPFLDPLAVVLVLPNYRNRVLRILKWDRFIRETTSLEQIKTQNSNTTRTF